jgi:hypothetical protein
MVAGAEPAGVLWTTLVLLVVSVVVAFTWAWCLLGGGVHNGVELHTIRRRDRAAGLRDYSSDAYKLRQLTFLPALFWVAVFVTGSLAALVLGGRILLGI